MGSSLMGLLKVDILNVMGPAMAGTALLWGGCRRNRDRIIMFGLVTIGVSLLTPPMRTFEWVRMLPDPIEWYLRPVAGRTNFTLFPWAGFVTAGALIGVSISGARGATAERRLMMTLAAGGLATAIAGYWTSYLPRLFEGASFWTSSPTFFVLRCGLLTAAVPAAWLWSSRLTRRGSWRPLEIFGRSSLFVYWIHVEMVYGVLSQPLHRALSLGQAVLAFAAFSLLLFGLVCLKDRLKSRLSATRSERR